MNPLPFHILLALAASDASAGDILHTIEHDVDSALMVRERSFYTALERLVGQNLVAVDNSTPRPRYHLAAFGRHRLQVEKSRLGRAVTLMHERL